MAHLQIWLSGKMFDVLRGVKRGYIAKLGSLPLNTLANGFTTDTSAQVGTDDLVAKDPEGFHTEMLYAHLKSCGRLQVAHHKALWESAGFGMHPASMKDTPQVMLGRCIWNAHSSKTLYIRDRSGRLLRAHHEICHQRFRRKTDLQQHAQLTDTHSGRIDAHTKDNKTSLFGRMISYAQGKTGRDRRTVYHSSSFSNYISDLDFRICWSVPQASNSYGSSPSWRTLGVGGDTGRACGQMAMPSIRLSN